jgi:hypothetical protein
MMASTQIVLTQEEKQIISLLKRTADSVESINPVFAGVYDGVRLAIESGIHRDEILK